MKHPIYFARDINGDLVDIDSAVKGQDYYCSCKSKLWIRQGEVRAKHFYHENHSKSCGLSALHLAYQEVFKRIKKIGLSAEFDHKTKLVFDQVILEEPIGDVIVDAVGYIGEKRYLIEFAKTSFIGVRKLEKLKKINLPVLEIDIDHFGKQTLKDIEYNLSQPYYKTWVHLPKYKEVTQLEEKVRQLNQQLISKGRDIELLQEKLAKKKWELSQEKREYPFRSGTLFYREDCNNGAKLYTNINLFGKKVKAFVTENALTIKYEPINFHDHE